MNDNVAKILDATDGGSDVFFREIEGYNLNKKKFRTGLREDRNPSASTFINNGKWYVKDHGDDSPAMDCFAYIQAKHGYTGEDGFKQSMNHIASMFNVQIEGIKPLSATYEKYIPTGKENWHVKDKFLYKAKKVPTAADLRTYGKYVTVKILSEYEIHIVDYYIVKGSKGGYHKFSSTDQYPIYVYKAGQSYKLYQPKQADKQYKFMWYGGKPTDWIFGEEQLKKDREKTYLCSGEKDAINLRSLGIENVVALNSETKQLTYDLYNRLRGDGALIAIPDTDSTGVHMARLNARTIWRLGTIYLEYMGKGKKDLTDWVNMTDSLESAQRFFNNMARGVKVAQFWYYTEAKEPKLMVSKSFIDYFINLYDYWVLEPDDKDRENKADVRFVHIQNNVCREVMARDIQHEVIRLIDRKNNHALSDKVRTSAYFTKGYLATLPQRSVPLYKNNDDKSVYIPFDREHVWRISTEGMEVQKTPKAIIQDKTLVTELIKKTKAKVTALAYNKIGKAPFEIKDGHVKILDKNNDFLRFLDKSSRMYHLEDQETLSEEKCAIQNQHLLNKIFAFGYLLCPIKIQSEGYAVVATDNNIIEDIEDVNKSHGGVGKGIFFKGLKYIQKIWSDGFSDEVKNNSDFKFQGLTEYDQVALMEDVNKSLKFKTLYNPITDDFDVNNKNLAQFTIPYHLSPKLAITTNHLFDIDDPSTNRRILYCLFSDYYGVKEDGTTFTAADDFGYMLFDDWNASQWNDFYTFCAYALQYYLLNMRAKDSHQAPRNVMNNKQSMLTVGKSFYDFAEVYFDPDLNPNHLNNYVIKSEAIAFYKEKSNIKSITSASFNAKLLEWCKLQGYELNPVELRTVNTGKIGRIKRVLVPGQKQEDCIYICTQPGQELSNTELESELPF